MTFRMLTMEDEQARIALDRAIVTRCCWSSSTYYLIYRC
jgi:hypothetical protein